VDLHVVRDRAAARHRTLEERRGRIGDVEDGDLVRLPLILAPAGDGEDVPFVRSVLHSDAVSETKKRFNSALLPQAYPEGCPTHPSFPAGHAVIAGACATVLKAWFSETWVLPTTSVPNADGTALVSYTGPDLTVGGELDKLAENVAIGRNWAGVHWRSDGIAGLRFGEAFAINFLREMKMTSRELFNGFSLTKFDGTHGVTGSLN
jgi:hypothetical protein